MEDDGSQISDNDNTSRGTFDRNLKNRDSFGTNKEKDLFGSIKSQNELDNNANGRDNQNNPYNQKKN